VEPLAADQHVTDDDIIESGSERPPPLPGWRPPRLLLPRWRLPRIAVILCAAGLVSGLAVGYAVGNAGKHAPPRLPPSVSALAVPPMIGADTPLGFDGSLCSQQVGNDLQLGMEVTNDSPALLAIVRVNALLPLGGLKQVSWAWGPCGELPGAPPPDQGLATGSSAWLTVTFRVLVSCPAPLPVQFTMHFILRSAQDSRGAQATVAAFPDLGQVAYSRCQ
jgi:hypothetical protein